MNVGGIPTRFAATSMVKRWRSPRLGCRRCPELDGVLDDAILGEMEENGVLDAAILGEMEETLVRWGRMVMAVL